MRSTFAERTIYSVERYRQQVAEILQPLGERSPVIVSLADALGRVLAEPVRAGMDLPAFSNSAMDGYAVRAEEVGQTPVNLPVTGVIAAGAPAPIAPLAPGTARKIMTGAPLPAGADCVIPVEDTHPRDTETVTIFRGRDPGTFIREPGTDIRAGQLLIDAGTMLAPQHLGALAAVGQVTVPVRAPVRVAILTTGSEVASPGTPLAPGQIYNSNAVALASAFEADGAQVTQVEHCADDAAAFQRLVDAAAQAADLVCTTGGVSQGDFEVVREVLGPLGGWFGSVAMQPGGPQGATVYRDVPIVSFPGNPVSALVSFAVLVRPILRELTGLPAVPSYLLPLLTPVHSPPNRRQFLRGQLVGPPERPIAVRPIGGPGSHLVAQMAAADVLIDIPAPVDTLTTGTYVRTWKLYPCP